VGLDLGTHTLTMEPIKIRRMQPPADGALLQPLREVGTTYKTQFWDLDEIYDALREANRLGIPPERFYPQRLG
jgi:hypothetical protein